MSLALGTLLSANRPDHLDQPGSHPLHAVFGDRLREKASLSRYTAARVGGVADALLEVISVEELVQACLLLWQEDLPFIILGGGSNVLVSDAGLRGVALINRARDVNFNAAAQPPTVWVESGANFGGLARQAAARGLSGLEWAAGIPGTVGGAVVGNAGAHGRDMASNLLVAEILHRDRDREQWSVDDLGYKYRSSLLKAPAQGGVGSGQLPSRSPEFVVLAALLRLEQSDPATVQERIDEYVTHRRRTQPPGASMGSMFKNPPGDYAGRLIEATGLKGTRVGDAEISNLHANFFINSGNATALDIYWLIQLARQKVAEKFDVELELEVELVGDWNIPGNNG
jgi:UDP-N-acetylmuramate dehydrogenase